MTPLLEDLFPEGAPQDVGFQPFARYFSSSDAMLYVREDGSYRADRVDPFLTVLWHPSEDRLVGVKLKGFRFLFERLSAILPTVKDGGFLPFVKALELALAAGWGEELTDSLQEERRRKYEFARELVRDVRIPEDELPKAA